MKFRISMSPRRAERKRPKFKQASSFAFKTSNGLMTVWCRSGRNLRPPTKSIAVARRNRAVVRATSNCSTASNWQGTPRNYRENRTPQIDQHGDFHLTNVALQPHGSDVWWVFLLQGFSGIILGLMLLTEPGATIEALTTLLGFYWLIMGLLALVQVFVDRATPWIWSLLTGLVGILAGLFVLRHPLIAALTVPTVLVIILGIQGLVMGVLELIGGFKGGGIGSVLFGVV